MPSVINQLIKCLTDCKIKIKCKSKCCKCSECDCYFQEGNQISPQISNENSPEKHNKEYITEL